MSVDWPGLLKWSVDYHDGTAPTNFKAMSDDDKNFLTKALEDAFSHIEDLNKVLKEGIAKLGSANSPEEELVALEVIDRCVDDPDCARNLELFGGVSVLLKSCLGREDLCKSEVEKEVIGKACGILKLMLANNPKEQDAAVEKYDALAHFVLEEDLRWRQEPLSTRQMGVLATIVRGNDKNSQLFMKEPFNGLDFLMHQYFLEPEQHGEDPDQEKRERLIFKEKVLLFLKHLVLEYFNTGVSRESKESLGIFWKRAMEELIEADDAEKNDAEYPTVRLDFSENLAQLGTVLTVDRPVAKRRIEQILRRGTKLEDPNFYDTELEALKEALSRGAPVSVL